MISNPTPQRTFRTPKPGRPTPRVAASGEHLATLAHRLTDRDRWLARMLHEHRVLTTGQIAELAFPTRHAANERLLPLYRWRVVDRFQPLTSHGGSAFHYVLDVAGNALLAHEDGIEPRDTGYRHERAVGIAYHLRLAHTVAVNTFFTRLIAAARREQPTGQLLAWWPERRCTRYFGDIAQPDAYGRWSDTHGELEFFLEYDWGTEPLATLARKIGDYHQLADATGITTPVLFVFPTHGREASARPALHAALTDTPRPTLVPLATSTLDATTPENVYQPTAPRWLPLASPGGRLGLTQLARTWRLAPRTPRTGSGHPPATPHAGLRPPPPMPPNDCAPHPWR